MAAPGPVVALILKHTLSGGKDQPKGGYGGYKPERYFRRGVFLHKGILPEVTAQNPLPLFGIVMVAPVVFGYYRSPHALLAGRAKNKTFRLLLG